MDTKSLAEKLGITPENIATRRADFSVLLKEGVIVDLNIKRFRGQKKLTKEDLGLAEMSDDEFLQFESEYLSLGHKNLLPADLRKKANSIEYGARSTLKANSYETNWGHFVPATTFAEWKLANDELKKSYYALLEETLDNWDQVREQVREDYLAAGRIAYRRLTTAGTVVGPQDEFVQKFADRVMASFPTQDEFKDSWVYDEAIYFYPLPREIQEELQEAQAAMEQRYMDQGKKDALRTMGRAVAEKGLAQREQVIDQFFSKVAGQLRNMVYDAVANVNDSIQKHGKIHHSTAGKLKNVVEKFRTLNFYDDDALEDQITRIQAILDVTDDGRETSATTEEMFKEIQQTVRRMIVDLGEIPRRERDIKTIDLPEPIEIATRRTPKEAGKLFLPETEPPPATRRQVQ